jgi:hypothetical protein
VSLAAVLALGAGCAAEVESQETRFDVAASEVTAADPSQALLELSRERIAGDVFHYSMLLRVGTTPNARLRLHRVVREAAPFQPRPSHHAVMMEHGDFATFTSNFISSPAPGEGDHRGLAPYLAERGVDVWGMDRRWTTTPGGEADVSDYASMGFASVVDDIGTALSFARAARTLSGAGADRMTLMGFSSGAMLTYSYAGAESVRPVAARHVKAIVPIDMYARIAPEDESLRTRACNRRDAGRADLAAGIVDIDNTFFQQTGALAQATPDDPSPFWPGLTNRQALIHFVGQTYFYFRPSDLYHLNGGVVEDETVTALRFSSERRVQDWLIGAKPHQAYVEGVDMDTIQCFEAPLPLADHLADISVPIFYLGAAGGYGDHGIHSTTVTRSTDVTTHVVRRLSPEQEAEDFGHADLLFAGDVPALAWRPLVAWLLRH